MTHTSTEQPEALRLAELIETGNRRSGDSAIAAELRRLHARVQELEAERTARMTQNDRMAERIAELEEQVQRAAEAERAAILLRVKNRAVAGALLVEDFRSIVADRGPAAPGQRAPLTDAQIKEGRNAVNDDPDDRPEPWAFREGVKFAERMHGITQEKQG